MKPQSTIDKWFMRTKDLIIIVTAVFGIIGYGSKFWKLPEIQEAQGHEIEILQKTDIDHDKQIAVLAQGMSDIGDIKKLLMGRAQ